MESDNDTIARMFVAAVRGAVEQEQRRLSHSLRQLSDEAVWTKPSPQVNCVGNIVLHLLGNLRQWFLHGLGGEPNVRNRPAEFENVPPIPKQQLQNDLDELFARIGTLLDGVTADTLVQRRRIQGWNKSLLEAIYSTVNHLEGHSLQVAYITHLLVGEAYEPFWRPQSVEEGAPKP